MKIIPGPFSCRKCGHKDAEFHMICPECGRPAVRDFIDTRLYPRDPDPNGIFSGKFWAKAFLIALFLGLAVSLLASLGYF
jgi:hypothetical protein